jgi:hypothetical protein
MLRHDGMILFIRIHVDFIETGSPGQDIRQRFIDPARCRVVTETPPRSCETHGLPQGLVIEEIPDQHQ